MSNDPVLIAFSAKRSKSSGKAHWTEIGRAYPHEEGAGLTVVLDVIPLDGRIVLLEPTDRDLARWLREAQTKHPKITG